MAPMANIILYEASDAEDGLFTAVQTAASKPGVVAVSMSWAGDEFSGETAYDSSTFVTPSGHIGGAASIGGAGLLGGVTFLAASGDSGAYSPLNTSTIMPEYPAASPNVVAVGGTSLTVNADNSYQGEMSWGNGISSGTAGGGGGGISLYESQPTYQFGSGLVSAYSSTARMYPDVSADADPDTGVPFYDSWDFTTDWGWLASPVGGTSLACPLWAGMIAVADEGRAIAGLGSLDGAQQTLPELYQAFKTAPTDFHDITSGDSIGPTAHINYSPQSGYDLATGLGSPVGNLLIPQLVGTTVTAVSSTQPAGAYGAGTTIPITVTFSEPVTVTGTPQLALNAGSGAVANYTGGSGTPVLTFSYTVAAGQNSSDLDYGSATALTLNGGSIQDAAGNAALLTLPTTGTDGLATQHIVIDTTTPMVTNVVVRSAAWTSSFLSSLAGQSSHNVGGYSIPVGSGAQLLALPWANINQLEVTFSENVVVNQSDLLLTGVNTPSYNVSGGTFSYDPTTFTATWTLPQSIGIDKLMLTLNAGGSGPIEDAAGNRLNGEWTNPTSTTSTGTTTYPSGNGVAGGDFDFRFNVLPGDATQDGTVDGYDLGEVLGNYTKSGKTGADGDFTGDGTVDGYDLSVLVGDYTKTLPSGEPAAGSFPADVPLAAATVPSQANMIPNVAMADNSGLEKTDVLAVALPTQPALVQSDAAEVFHASAAVTTPRADGLQPAAASILAALTAGVGDSSSPPVSAVADRGLLFVVRPPVSAAQSLWADGSSIAAGRPTIPWADVAGDTSLWNETVPAGNVSSSFVPGEKSTGTERTIHDQVKTVFTDQARAHDAVLAGELASPPPSEMSWLWDAASARRSRHPASDLESLTDAVDNVLLAYNDESYDV